MMLARTALGLLLLGQSYAAVSRRPPGHASKDKTDSQPVNKADELDDRALGIDLPGVTIDAGNILSIGLGGVTVTLGKADAATTSWAPSKTSATPSAKKTSSWSTTKATPSAVSAKAALSSVSKSVNAAKSTWLSSAVKSSAKPTSKNSAKPTSKSSAPSSPSKASTSASKSSSAATTSSAGCASASGDAPYSLSCSDLASTVTFPNGNQKKPGGIILLVHGTGSQADETWATGPYYTILPDKGIGYDIAWFNSPTRSLGDAQVTSEYIAYNIKALAGQSSTGKVFIIAHSQGNINVQWALEFWPSARDYVSGFVSLAGDFHGTAEGPLLCTGQDLVQGGCEPSVIQQSVGSHYLAALNSQGGSALVSTTSLYTLEDDIIQPEVVDPTSQLPGSAFYSVQDACTDLFLADHFTMTVTAPAFYLAYDALTHGGQASLSRFDATTQCSFLVETGQTDPFSTVGGLLKQVVLDAVSVGLYEPKQAAEPQLMDYVCSKGAASSYCVSS